MQYIFQRFPHVPHTFHSYQLHIMLIEKDPSLGIPDSAHGSSPFSLRLGTRVAQGDVHVFPAANRHLSIDNRKDRILNIQDKPASTLSHQLAALGVVERWLSENHPTESAKIEQIAPAKLDHYLAEFFTTITKPCGDSYGVSYLSSLRSRLERHLREHSYPCSIIRSHEFHASQNAFKMRMMSLQTQAVEPTTLDS